MNDFLVYESDPPQIQASHLKTADR